LAAIGTELVASTYRSGVFRSTDDGASWTLANQGLPNNNNTVDQFAVIGSNLVAEVSRDGFFLSSDNGGSWTLEGKGPFLGEVVSLAVSGTDLFGIFYFDDCYCDSIFRSTDYGH